MGGGSVPTPATTAMNQHSQPQFCPTVSSNFNTESYCLIDEHERMASGYFDQTNFGPVPSHIEIQNAILNLQRVMNGFCATSSEINEVGEIMDQSTYDLSRSNLMKSLGQKRLVDAYHLLQTDSSVQRLVLSVSSDPEVWGAILQNDAVRDLQGSLPNTEIEEQGMSYMKDSDSTSVIVKWIFAFMKSKISEFIEKLESFVFEALQCVSKNKKSTSKLDDLLEEKVRSSLLLSVVILMIVVVTRSFEA